MTIKLVLDDGTYFRNKDIIPEELKKEVYNR